jgi:hypothetical protein
MLLRLVTVLLTIFVFAACEEGLAGSGPAATVSEKNPIKKENALRLYVQSTEANVETSTGNAALLEQLEENDFRKASVKLQSYFETQKKAFKLFERATAHEKISFPEISMRGSAIEISKLLQVLRGYLAVTAVLIGNPDDKIQRYKNVFRFVKHFAQPRAGYAFIGLSGAVETILVGHGKRLCGEKESKICGDFKSIVSAHLKRRPDATLILESEKQFFESALTLITNNFRKAENGTDFADKVEKHARLKMNEFLALCLVALKSQEKQDWDKVDALVRETRATWKGIAKDHQEFLQIPDSNSSQKIEMAENILSKSNTNPPLADKFGHAIFLLSKSDLKDVITEYQDDTKKLKEFVFNH